MKNIVFVVWDACSRSTAVEHAPFLQELANENLSFSNAITPAGWSLPAHASLFTGQYPHKHGVNKVTDNFRETPQINQFSEKGYKTFGISGNGFASPRFNLDKNFDKFISTHEEMIYPEAFDIRNHIQKIKQENKEEFEIRPIPLAIDIITDPYPLKSVINASAAAINFVTRNGSWLNNIPHRRFQTNGGFGYNPDKNTTAIINSIESEPFFIFSNYMNTHRPYDPPRDLQEEYLNKSLGLSELVRLDNIAHPYKYAERKSQGDKINVEDLGKIRKLHYAEVRYADRQLKNLYNEIMGSSANETVFIITADHGENLGEKDMLGEKWMGHWNSASEELLNVPLVIAGESIPSMEITNHFSTRNILPLIYEFLFEAGEKFDKRLFDKFTEDIVLSEYPLTGRSDLLDESYNISEEYLEREIVVGYHNGVKYITMGNGTEISIELESGTQVSPTELLVSETKKARDLLADQTEESINENLQSQLEDLGYI
jgi:arylsulfatase A-like enzyme